MAAPRIALVLTPLDDKNLALAAQVGATDIVYYDMDGMPSTVEEILAIKRRIESFNLRLSVIEGGPRMDAIVRGEPADAVAAQLAHYATCVRAMGAAGVPVLCYNFMPWEFRVGRTSYCAPLRGGSYTSEWRPAAMPPEKRSTPLTHEALWRNFAAFLAAIVPVCEEAGVRLALHPDDPPVEEIGGIPRIINSPDAVARALALSDSPAHGITFCQGVFAQMPGGGAAVPDLIRRFGPRTHFVHFRNVAGTVADAGGFVETWQDDGDTDMAECIRAWRSVGYAGAVRPDHVPLMPGIEGSGRREYEGYVQGYASGYTMMGRLFAVGYMRGIIQSVFGHVAGGVKAARLRPDDEVPPGGVPPPPREVLAH